MPMQPHNMTDDEILTEAENRFPADPLVSALVKMAAGQESDHEDAAEYRQIAEDFGLSFAEDLKTRLQQAEDLDDEIHYHLNTSSADDVRAFFNRLDEARAGLEGISLDEIPGALVNLAEYEDVAARYSAHTPAELADVLAELQAGE